MTPTVDVSDDISASLDSKMDAVFNPPAAEPAPSAPSPPRETPESQAIELAEYEYNPEPAQTAPIDAATGTEEAPEDLDIPAGDEDEEIDLSKFETENRKVLKVDRSRFNNIYQGHKMAQAIKQFARSVEDARSHYEKANDLRQMHADFISGQDAGVDGFLKFWKESSPDAFGQMTSRAVMMASPEIQESIHDGLVQMTTGAMDRLPPDMQERISDVAISRAIENRYAAAVESGDPQKIYEARQFDYNLTKSWRDDARLQQVRTSPKPDPMAERDRQLAEREQKIAEREQRETEGRWKAWHTGTTAAITQSLTAAIDEILKPVAANYSPEEMRAIKGDIQTQVLQKVKDDREWMRGFNLDYGNARGDQSDQKRADLVNSYASKARPHIRAVAKPILSKFTETKVAQNQQQHAALARSQDRREVLSGGSPPPTRVQTPPAGANVDAKMDAFFQQQDRNKLAAARR